MNFASGKIEIIIHIFFLKILLKCLKLHKFLQNSIEKNMTKNSIVRLRFGMMNDALCEIYWAGPKKQNIGMGYICEGDSIETALEVK